MKDYIEREAAIKGFTDMLQKPGDIYPTDITTMLNGIPAADVKPVVRGEWIDYKDEHQCSICRDVVVIDYLVWEHERYDFCPHCGADMRGENNG